jgi:hypothetical protein
MLFAAACGAGQTTGASHRIGAKIDEVVGRYENVALGDRERMVLADYHGRYKVTDHVVGGFAPDTLPSDSDRVVALGNGLQITFVRGRVAAMVISDRGASTRRGIAVGGPMRSVTTAYVAACRTENRGAEFTQLAECEAKIAPQRYVIWTGDPILAATLSTEPVNAPTCSRSPATNTRRGACLRRQHA